MNCCRRPKELLVRSAIIVAGLLALQIAAAVQSQPAATAHNSAPINRIDVEAIVDGSLEDVWRCWTTNQGAQTFFAARSNIQLSIGGAYEILFNTDAPEGEQGSEGCKVLSFLPMEMLSFSWNAPPMFAHARAERTWVVVRLEAIASQQTRVKLSHLGWDEKAHADPEHADEWVQTREYFAKAWPHVLENLRKCFHQRSNEQPRPNQ
jgi:uncharacterized protein YndB with AHSA1/START domain